MFAAPRSRDFTSDMSVVSRANFLCHPRSWIKPATGILVALAVFLLCILGPALGAKTTEPSGPPSSSENYRRHCIDCHGVDGRSLTRLGRKSGASNLANPKVMASLSDADIFKTIKFGRIYNGEEKMEGYGQNIPDAEISELIQFVRQFAK